MNEKRRVLIALESKQDGGAKTVQTFRGQFYPKDRSVYVRYDEDDELHGTVRTLLRWTPGELSLTRRGGVESEQTFAAGSRRPGRYRSPHLSFPLETETTELTAEQGGCGLPLTLQWSYTLHIGQQESSRFQLRLHIREDNS
ncbi:DUF1934 domain-containing protein [Paenibacillus beijingensis]|uniref:DUF1934 domain-containing protein n=1 Tax=Paenibacillus beijingensis TaxID=1126833 RepID=A0A0D5NI84_9BACL|nr:DUF1934 domain-containing protein [Paenibacillus beijingensis]AJY74996.1 hypothetical protein VN24_10890 [Paenibacillus beijingensis]